MKNKKLIHEEFNEFKRGEIGNKDYNFGWDQWGMLFLVKEIRELKEEIKQLEKE